MGEVIEVIPEEETAIELVNMSKLCIGLDHTITSLSSIITQNHHDSMTNNKWYIQEDAVGDKYYPEDYTTLDQ